MGVNARRGVTVKGQTFLYKNRNFFSAPPKVSPRSNPNKVGRNDPCPCGSGKKAKKCCWDDIHRALNIDRRKVRKMPLENLEQLIYDLENNTYGEAYIRERSTIINDNGF
jgi:hypothetical protein